MSESTATAERSESATLLGVLRVHDREWTERVVELARRGGGVQRYRLGRGVSDTKRLPRSAALWVLLQMDAGIASALRSAGLQDPEALGALLSLSGEEPEPIDGPDIELEDDFERALEVYVSASTSDRQIDIADIAVAILSSARDSTSGLFRGRLEKLGVDIAAAVEATTSLLPSETAIRESGSWKAAIAAAEALAIGEVRALAPEGEPASEDTHRRAMVEPRHILWALAIAHGGTGELNAMLRHFDQPDEVLALPPLQARLKTDPVGQLAELVREGRGPVGAVWSPQADRVRAAAVKLAQLATDPETGVSWARIRDLLGGILLTENEARSGLRRNLSEDVPFKELLDSYPVFLREPYRYEYEEFLKKGRHRVESEVVVGLEPVGLPYAGFDHDAVPGHGLLAGDQLNIRPHVESIALLTASKALVPPLAIGLFGNWGAGKTYFMQALRQEVDRLTREARLTGRPQRDLDIFRNVVQIEFNAWHYVDTNLWASLTDHVFANLRIATDEDRASILGRRAYYVEQLKKQGAALRQVESQRQHLVWQINEAALNLERIEAERTRHISILDVVRAQVAADSETRDQAKALLEQTGVASTYETATDLRSGLGEARSTLLEGRRLLGALQGRYGPWWMVIAAVALLAGPIIGMLLVLRLGDGLDSALAAVTSVMTASVAFIGVANRGARETLERVNDLDGALRDEVENSDEVTAARAAVEQLDRQRTDALEKEKELREEIEKLESELQAINPERLLADFIISRRDSDDYRKHLGLASLIRRDFEALADLIGAFNVELERPADDTESQSPDVEARQETAGEDSDRSQFHINRVVLYIDDLDRCPPKQVVEVLQAVHLLLAFKLFVVVVGVDARWLARALSSRYQGLLSTEGDTEEDDPEKARAATPHDYLEKIFQIPFWLREMSPDAQSRLLTSLTGQNTEARVAAAGGVDGSAPVETHGDPGERVPEAPDGTPAAATTDGAERTVGSDAAADPEADADAEDDLVVAPISIASILVTEEERLFMDELRPLLGRSPRSLTRFINVYRIIKAVAAREGSPDPEGSVPGEELAMFLLGVVTGMPQISARFFRDIQRPHSMRTLREVVVAHANDEKDGTNERWRQLASWLGERPAWNEIHIDDPALRQWSDRVARYSYRIGKS